VAFEPIHTDGKEEGVFVKVLGKRMREGGRYPYEICTKKGCNANDRLSQSSTCSVCCAKSSFHARRLLFKVLILTFSQHGRWYLAKDLKKISPKITPIEKRHSNA
jgi:hypothetical protein